MTEQHVPYEDPVIVEPQEPVGNLWEKFNRYFYLRGHVTREARFGHASENPDGIAYPLFARARRARLHEQILKGRREGRSHDDLKGDLDEAHKLDEVLKQYVSQSTLRLPQGELGVNSSKRITLRAADAAPDKPPVFLVPGISGDIETMGNFAVEVAMRGREVTVVGYPESYNGSVTKEFADAVVTDSNYAPHASYFADALTHCYPEGDVELWGYSTGAPIAAEILGEYPDVRERISNAVLVSPASVTDQSELSLKIGLARDVGIVTKGSGMVPHMNWTTGIRTAQKTDAPNNSAIRKIAFDGLLSHISKKSSVWDRMCVRDGAHATFVVGTRDEVVKAQRSLALLSHIPNAVVRTIDGYHASALVQPGEVLEVL